MAIELIGNRSRSNVVGLRDAIPPDGKQAFTDREYAVEPEPCTDEQLENPAFLSGISAVVIAQSEAKPLQVTRDLERHARRLMDYDCRIILRPTPKGIAIIANTINELMLPT